jgi:hypothetical protein
LTTTTCLSCGGEIDPSANVCPNCGSRRRPRLGPSMLWGNPWGRRISSIVGILLALALLGYLGWTVATQGKGESRSNPVPVHS